AGASGMERGTRIIDERAFVDVLFFFQAEDGIRDRNVNWSSDVCSSDLVPSFPYSRRERACHPERRRREGSGSQATACPSGSPGEIGRASCRERGRSAVAGG